MKKYVCAAVLLTLVALGFRLFLALRLPNDAPDDGRVYARIARNTVQHSSYSLETEEPFSPTLIRVPGYPFYLAAVYAVFGIDNNTAVRVLQGFVSAATCWLVALLAFIWAPATWEIDRRRRALLFGLALSAVCPFTAIYVSTILTETWATFFATASVLAASIAIKRADRPGSRWRWLVADCLAAR
jgi:hypothetical protein